MGEIILAGSEPSMEAHFEAFKHELGMLIRKYRMDVSVGVGATDIADYVVDQFAALRNIADKFRG